MAEATQEVIISSPLYIDMPRKTKGPKRYHLNLNYYYHWHFIIKNNLKKAYTNLIEPQIRDLNFNKIELTLTLFKGTKRRTDRSNVLSIHEKFFCDALVQSGCIIDDNDDFLSSTHYYSGGIDRENPRVEIKIQEVS